MKVMYWMRIKLLRKSTGSMSACIILIKYLRNVCTSDDNIAINKFSQFVFQKDEELSVSYTGQLEGVTLRHKCGCVTPFL